MKQYVLIVIMEKSFLNIQGHTDSMVMIKVSKDTKAELDKLKSKNISYEEVIIGLIKKKTIVDKKLLVEGYEQISGENKKITKEFESIEEGWKW